MRGWWRWTLRGIAILALVGGGVLLALHPNALYYPPHSNLHGYPATCLSPFNRLTGTQQFTLPRYENPPPSVILAVRAEARVCSAATNGREHIVDLLGIGAVVLVGLSFLPRRRHVATTALEPSPV